MNIQCTVVHSCAMYTHADTKILVLTCIQHSMHMCAAHALYTTVLLYLFYVLPSYPTLAL
jgi:hypothetical protein